MQSFTSLVYPHSSFHSKLRLNSHPCSARQPPAGSIPFARFAAAALQCVALFFLSPGSDASVYGQTEDRSVATVNGRSITQKEVDSLIISQTLPLEEKLYAIRKAALDNLITSRLLADEAEKRGLSVAQLRKELAAGDVHITPNQVDEAYAENASFFASMSPDEAKERLRLDMENHARMQNYRVALGKLREAAKIDLLLLEPRVTLVTDDLAAPSIGPKEALVTVVEFSDFECPYCRGAQSAINQILTVYGKEVRLVFKHLPLQVHEQAFPAAQAAFCAGEQGAFWRYHDALFTSDSLSSDTFDNIASRLNLDVSKFKNCLTSGAAGAAVRSNMREATKSGINSTPTFIINGKLVRGAISFEEFKAIIERELKIAQSSSRLQQPQPARKD
jgi:protein-disulfide isomerase